MRLAALVHGKQVYKPKPGDEGLLEGLLSLTDEIADQAHEHGIGCLLVDEMTPAANAKNPASFIRASPASWPTWKTAVWLKVPR